MSKMFWSEAYKRLKNGEKVYNCAWRTALIPAFQYLYKQNDVIYLKIRDYKDIDYFGSDVLSPRIPPYGWEVYEEEEKEAG